MVERIRAQEEPLPTIRDRWGNAIPVVGYGTGAYYRLSRQPIWVIRQLAPGVVAANDPKGNGKGYGDQNTQGGRDTQGPGNMGAGRGWSGNTPG